MCSFRNDGENVTLLGIGRKKTKKNNFNYIANEYIKVVKSLTTEKDIMYTAKVVVKITLDKNSNTQLP